MEAAYRRLARKYHPDVSRDPESHEKMIAINKAWEQLRDPTKRAAVDRARMRTSGNAAWVAAADAQARTAHTAPATPVRHEPPDRATTQSPGVTQSAGASPGPGGSANRPFGSMSDPADSTAGGAAAGPGPRAWTTGRLPIGGVSSGATSRPDGEGASGPPPGNPSGSVLNFGRYAGWSLGEIARTEVEYLEWLDRMPIGRTYQQEIDAILRAKGLRLSRGASERGRGGAFRRR
ncbi:MAG: DnaJ domain-containing protein [Candidatus Limnocylindrales bacterium]